MAYEEILTVNSSIQSKRTTKTTADNSTEVLKDGELLIVRDGTNPPNLRAGDGTTQIKNLKDMVPGVASTSTAGLMSASDKTKLDGIETGANKTIVDLTPSPTSTNPLQNKVITNALGSRLPLSGGTMTGALTTKGIKLTPGTDYGDTLPSNPETDQLFFRTVGSNFVLNNVYPVGSIYMSVNSSNPGTLFGGTWEQIQGKFLLGMSSEYPAGSEGGETTHTLTTSEIPSHRHSIPSLSGSAKSNGGHTHDVQGGAGSGGSSAGLESYGSGYSSFRTISNAAYSAGSHTHDVTTNASNTGYEGGGNAHNNMPPYLSVYIWKRTA